MSKEIQFLLYSLPDEECKVQVVIKDETLWCTQKAMAQLFGVGVSAISKHLKNIFEEGELSPEMTISKMETVINRGKRGEVNEFIDFYNLDAIIAVGYRVSSLKATRFRQWATTILNEYIRKGFAMDDERLKNDGSILTKKYFEEQLERIREIRSSERKFYQKITDIYATAIDYDKDATATKRFYATVQNKMHFAVHGHTAAELIVARADARKNHMGLTTWQDAPNGKIKKSDVTVAKNYLTEKELGQLNRMVSAYLDFAENMANRHIPLTMADWEKRLNGFIEMFEYGLLQDAGKVTAEIAKLHAETEFEKYRIVQDRLYKSDFDRFIEDEGSL